MVAVRVVRLCACVHACVYMHRKIQISKVLLEIINILLIFSYKITKRELLKQKQFPLKKKSWFENLHITNSMYNIC